MAESETSALVVPRIDSEIRAVTDYDRGVLNALAHRRRRYTIHALKREDGPVSLGELATWIVCWEMGMDPEQVPESTREGVEMALLRDHLPALAEHGFIEFEHQDQMITPSQWISDHNIYISVSDRRPRFWPPYYLAMSLIGIVGLTLSWQAMWPIVDISADIWLLVLVIGLAGLAIIHHWHRSRLQLGRQIRPPG